MVCKNCPYQSACELKYPCMTGAFNETLKEVHMVVEGVHTAKAAYELSKKYDVNMPIVKEANSILFEDKDARQAVRELMTREKTTE